MLLGQCTPSLPSPLNLLLQIPWWQENWVTRLGGATWKGRATIPDSAPGAPLPQGAVVQGLCEALLSLLCSGNDSYCEKRLEGLG